MTRASRATWGWVALAVLLVCVMAGRLLLGIDTSDESYYVAFLHEWLAHGIDSGNSLMVHQTGALLLFPLAKSFVFLTGSDTGIVLFLRAIYLVMAIIAGWTVYHVARVVGVQRPLAALAGFFVATFIPWSLPAPSYNTIGMFGFLIGAFGLVALILQPSRTRFGLTVFTGAALGASTFAYPGFAIAVAALLAALSFVSRSRRAIGAVAVVAVAVIATATAFAFVTMGGHQLLEIVRFTLAAHEPVPITSQIAAIFMPGSSNLGFAVLTLCAVALGIALHVRHNTNQRRERSLYILLMALVLSVDALTPVALFSRSHDVVFLLVCFGLGVFGFGAAHGRPTANDARLRRVLCTAYWAAVLAALVSTWSAVMGPLSFHVGGLTAAGLVLAFTGMVASADWRPMAALASVAIALNVASAFAFSYGDPLTGPLAVVSSGPYAGLITEPARVAFLEEARRELNANCGTTGKVLVIGLPGLYILGQWTQASLWTFGSNPGSPSAEAMARSFLSAAENTPDCIAVYESGQIPPFEAESAVLTRARRVRHIQAPIPLGGFLDIFVLPRQPSLDIAPRHMSIRARRAAMQEGRG
jgi:hypothetical protein